MPGTAARRDSGGDVTEQAARALAREAIQVRDARGLELRFAGLGSRRPSEAVEGKEHDLRVVGDDERLEEIEHFGAGLSSQCTDGSKSPTAVFRGGEALRD